MAKYLLTVDYRPGVADRPMTEWAPAEIKANLDYHEALHRELTAGGELLERHALTGPEMAKLVTAGAGPPVVTAGPFTEPRQMLAGFQLVDVDSPERAIEIAAKLSRAPGPGGRPLEQPIGVRRLMSVSGHEALTLPTP
jgi:hypothetical protein